MRIQILVIFPLFIYFSKCANILAIFPTPCFSHQMPTVLLKELAKKGHHITIITPFRQQIPENYSYDQIILDGFLEKHEKLRSRVDFFKLEKISTFILIPFAMRELLGFTEYVLNHTKVQTFLKSNHTYDLVIMEQLANDALKGFSSHFKAPLIVLSPFSSNTWFNIPMGNPSLPSYAADIWLGYSFPFTFYEKVISTLFFIYTRTLYHFYVLSRQKILFEKYFPNQNASFDEVLYSASIAFINSHHSFSQGLPYLPNMINIGGFHLKKQKLPEDLKKFLDKEKNVIYFSLGSYLRSSEMSPDKIDIFTKTFAKLNFTVLWKWEKDDFPEKLKNVKIQKWLPQQAILAHPNVKLFISHGGYLSCFEAIYHKVPILAIPITGDNKQTSINIVNEGFGLLLNYQNITEKSLTNAIDKILNDQKFYFRVKDKSQLFRDHLVSPLEKAVFWVERVLRHKGAPDLKLSSFHLPWYKYVLNDVVIVLLLIMVFWFFVCFFALRQIGWNFYSSNQKFKQT